jgi:hypothetical protein
MTTQELIYFAILPLVIAFIVVVAGEAYRARLLTMQLEEDPKEPQRRHPQAASEQTGLKAVGRFGIPAIAAAIGAILAIVIALIHYYL